MNIKKLLAESDNHVLIFIHNNWGLAISIKARFKFRCSDEDLLGYCIEAYEEAERTYEEKRNKGTGKKYELANHWGQYLKSLITREKRRQARELSLEDLLENNPAALMQRKKYASSIGEASEILKTIRSEKKASEIALLHRHGYDVSFIATETNIPLDKVAKVVAIINDINPAGAMGGTYHPQIGQS